MALQWCTGVLYASFSYSALLGAALSRLQPIPMRVSLETPEGLEVVGSAILETQFCGSSICLPAYVVNAQALFEIGNETHEYSRSLPIQIGAFPYVMRVPLISIENCTDVSHSHVTSFVFVICMHVMNSLLPVMSLPSPCCRAYSQTHRLSTLTPFSWRLSSSSRLC